MRKQTKIAALVSAAALLAIGASMTSFAAWDQTSAGEWIYKDADGDRVYGEWRKSGENWYYLDESTGVMATDKLIEYNNEWYYVNADGVRVADAWKDFTANDEIYLSFDQAFSEGTIEPSVVWYRFGENGKAIRATEKNAHGDGKVVQKIDDRYYVFDDEGRMLSGWTEDVYKDDGSVNYYYLGSEGEGWATTGWKQIFTTTQGDNGDGAPFETTSDKWFHFSDAGVMDVGKSGAPKCVGINGVYYFFNERGEMLTDQKVPVATPPTSYPNASGMNAWVQADGSTIINGWYETKDADDNVIWYYLINKTVKDKDGKNTTLHGVPFGKAENSEDGSDSVYMGKVINGKKYLFRTSDGLMVTGRKTLTYDVTLEYDSNLAGRPTSCVFGLVPAAEVDASAGKYSSGKYIFNTGSGSVNGELMIGKFDIDLDEDGTAESYYSDKNGRLYTNVLVNGSLYNDDGVCYKADDGNSYMLVNVTDYIGKYMVGTGKNAYRLGYDSKNEKKIATSLSKTYVVVSSSGKVKQSASKLKVGDDYVTIDNYIVTGWAD